MLMITEIESWREAAACADRTDPDFFSDDNVGTRRASALCDSCPVVDDCLAYAIETNQPYGIWGGRTPVERATLRRLWLKDLRRAS